MLEARQPSKRAVPVTNTLENDSVHPTHPFQLFSQANCVRTNAEDVENQTYCHTKY